MAKLFWTLERLKMEALKWDSRAEFRKNNPNAYGSAKSRGLMDQICNHMKLLRRKAYTKNDLADIAKLYFSRGEFQKKNPTAYGAVLNMRILEEVCGHMATPATKPYTFEEIMEEAKKFTTRSQFQMKSLAYRAAWRRGILDQVCSHMPRHADQCGKNNASFKWENVQIYEEAMKYQKRTDFKFGNPKKYDVAVQRQILDSVCAHMKRAINVSGPELELLNKIKQFYPSTTTLRIRDVKMDSKPHIKGFYLDIYVPELKRGIEFDGRWHHSVEGLKRSHKNWPLEDILNYHALKDSHFFSKGIAVLHIKEEDWIIDKNQCVKKCLEFLGAR